MSIWQTIAYAFGFIICCIILRFWWGINHFYKKYPEYFETERDREFKCYDKELQKYLKKKKYWIL